jgi:hypothetical protein
MLAGTSETSVTKGPTLKLSAQEMTSYLCRYEWPRIELYYIIKQSNIFKCIIYLELIMNVFWKDPFVCNHLQ